jgi:predicted nucleic acid-binding protein
VLVDTSVWIDHFRGPNTLLSKRLEAGEVWTHPFVIGELACGNLSHRREILRSLAELHSAPVVDHHELLQLIEGRRLNGLGLGWIDMHLLASAYVGELPLWALDKRLVAAARELGLKPPLSLN